MVSENRKKIELTILRLMELPIKLNTINSGWYIVYIEGTRYFLQKYYNSFSEDRFV